jgi:hypothetical protein
MLALVPKPNQYQSNMLQYWPHLVLLFLPRNQSMFSFNPQNLSSGAKHATEKCCTCIFQTLVKDDLGKYQIHGFLSSSLVVEFIFSTDRNYIY